MQRRFLVFVLLFATVALAQKPQDPVGQWNLQADAQGEISKFTLTITKEGAVLKGKIASEQYGPQDLTDLKFENDVLTYTRNLDLGGQVIAMAFKGKIEGDKLTGTYDIMGLELPVTGSRKTAADPPAKK
jgi:hypothetical protein